VLLGITTGGKIGLGVVAGIFLAFAIASAWWFPRRNPDFPGERLGPVVAVTVLLFLALMGAVLYFAKEEEEEGHAEAAATQPAETGAETGEEGGGGEEGGAQEGDAAAGESVFASAGCGGCHVLEAAGTSGSVGPNLDESQPDFELAVDRVTNGSGAMPSFSDQLSEQQIRDVAAYVVESTQ
jgi:mono/diheme cytochrome c family protein